MIYFDHASTQSADPEVLDFFVKCHGNGGFANPEAAHQAGKMTAKRLENAEEKLKKLLKITDDSVILWGNSGSELFRFIGAAGLKGAALSSRAEHPALTANLKNAGLLPVFAPLQNNGKITEIPENNGFSLAAFSVVNSEIGVINDFDILSDKVHETAPQSLMFADFIQGAGKMMPPEKWDFLAVSGHKFGAPGGSALLCRSSGIAGKIAAYRHRDYLTGRPEVPLIESMVFALEKMTEKMTENYDKITEINLFLREKLQNSVIFTANAGDCSPYILHFSVPDHQSGVLLRMLSEYGIMTAAGSACQAESPQPSPVLKALKWSDKKAYSAMRLSFAPSNTMQEAEFFVKTFYKVLENY